MKFDQDLRLILRYDFGKMNSTLGSVVPLAMFVFYTLILRKYQVEETLILNQSSFGSKKHSQCAAIYHWSRIFKTTR